MSKGDWKRPRTVSKDEYDKRHEAAFGRTFDAIVDEVVSGADEKVVKFATDNDVDIRPGMKIEIRYYPVEVT